MRPLFIRGTRRVRFAETSRRPAGQTLRQPSVGNGLTAVRIAEIDQRLPIQA